jgi:hypothetical protein
MERIHEGIFLRRDRNSGVADLKYESSCIGFLKPRFKLTFGYVKSWHSYLDSATPKFAVREDFPTGFLSLIGNFGFETPPFYGGFAIKF